MRDWGRYHTWKIHAAGSFVLFVLAFSYSLLWAPFLGVHLESFASVVLVIGCCMLVANRHFAAVQCPNCGDEIHVDEEVVGSFFSQHCFHCKIKVGTQNEFINDLSVTRQVLQKGWFVHGLAIVGVLQVFLFLEYAKGLYRERPLAESHVEIALTGVMDPSTSKASGRSFGSVKYGPTDVSVCFSSDVMPDQFRKYLSDRKLPDFDGGALRVNGVVAREVEKCVYMWTLSSRGEMRKLPAAPPFVASARAGARPSCRL